MIIREADLDKDALAIADGAEKFAKKMGLGNFVSDNFIDSLARMVTMSNIRIYIAEDNGSPVGGIGINYAPYMWNHNLLIADELFWWADENAPPRTGLMLFNKAIKEIDKVGAIPVFRKLENSPKGVDKVYRKERMIPMETIYMRPA